MRKWRLAGSAVGLAMVLALSPLAAPGKLPARADEPRAQGEAAPGEGKRAQDFIAAFHRGDARAVAGFWTADGDYVDQAGREHKGRAALEKLYQKVFAENKGAKLNIIVTSLKQLTPDVVLEDGITQVTPADGGPPTAARFHAVLVRKDGEWYFQSVRDSVAYPPSNAEHFGELEGLIGDWVGEATRGESGTASYRWAENRNFIVSSFATTLNGVPVVGGTQWIAWDALDKRIRSWSFYSGGGFGEASWEKEGGKWLIKTSARTADGKKASATNILTLTDADHLTWQVTDLTVDGKSVPSAPALKMKRVKPEGPK